MELEVIGQTVKGRDIHLVKYISNPANPTILYLTQQHGNEQLTTEGALEFIKHLGTGKAQGVLDGVNILPALRGESPLPQRPIPATSFAMWRGSSSSWNERFRERTSLFAWGMTSTKFVSALYAT